MTNEEMKQLTERVQEKIGKEASGLIADDIGLLISDTSKTTSSLGLLVISRESILYLFIYLSEI